MTKCEWLFLCFAFVVPALNGSRLLAATNHALLVGCTQYDSLPDSKQLKGPENDIRLFRRVLIDRFDFDPQTDSITMLGSSQGKEYQPTKANIEREFRRLAEIVRKDERVVILLSGHGSQEPDDDPDNPLDHEPDGYDETFLPCDIGNWNARIGIVENSIRDDELRKWLGKILQREAKVWMIMDACHSGSGVRGSGVETLRQVPPDLLVPMAALSEAKRKALETDVTATGESLFDGLGEIVAIYAAQPHESTPERLLPRGVDPSAQQMHGLLTFTICDVLNRMQGKVTYNELVEAVQTRYVLMGKREPTPLIEGNRCDQLVMGQESFPSRSFFRLQKGFSWDPLRLDAGALDGLTVGSVLAVFPPEIDTKDSDDAIGHVKVIGVDMTGATVQPCRFGGAAVPTRQQLSNRARCKVVQKQICKNRLNLGVDIAHNLNATINEQQWTALVNLLRSTEQPLVQVVDEIDDATWLVRVGKDSVTLVPAGGVASGRENDRVERVITFDRDEGWEKRLMTVCGRIARAESLLQLSEIGAAVTRDKETGLKLTVLADGQPLAWKSDGRTLLDGQSVTVEIENRMRQSVDLTVLYVDSRYGITCLYPRVGEYNRLAPGNIDRIKLTVNSETTGVENIVVIGSVAAGQPKDYRFLEQPTLVAESNRGVPADPLRQLFETTVYDRGDHRGVTADQAVRCQVHVLTWRVVASN